ncbi:MAG: hypothetical protein K8W52_31880 [Deltaproteobacteria bacterium]|nr:hypothetical protein [Deltaproteobacteria bacterium]
MRALLLAALAVTTSACTHHYKIAAGRELPEDRTDHVDGALQGAGIGLLAGASSGVVLGLAAGDDPPCSVGDDWFCPGLSRDAKAVILGASGAVIGAASGAVIGAIVGRTETYEYADGAVPRISATLAPGGASATAAWSF